MKIFNSRLPSMINNDQYRPKKRKSLNFLLSSFLPAFITIHHCICMDKICKLTTTYYPFPTKIKINLYSNHPLLYFYNLPTCYPNCNKAHWLPHSDATISPHKYNVQPITRRRRPTQKHHPQTKQSGLQTLEKSVRTQKSTQPLRRFPQRTHAQR